MTDQPRPHHHGNLREALIRAGLELMEEGGPDALTLRKCARRAGVSHAAPAHHFNGLPSLKAAIIARGYRMFAQTMRDYRKAAKTDPQAQLAAICDGYIAFSRQHTAVFKFMFQPHNLDIEALDKTTATELEHDSIASYRILQQACEPFADENGDNASTEIMVWSLVHGYAMLFCNPCENSLSPPQTIPDFSHILPMLKLKTNPACK